ncbi:MAG: sensor histidine kinase, partial [Lachnospiraceae bacterium]|nr:sensor histidine kinase [Lachnospiraceae bacterium]
FEDFDKTVIVSADPNMLNRVIQNLISNGVKYANGDITFHICQKDEQTIITVSNPINTYVDAAHIFDRFYTQDKSRNKGSGIGLYICRQLIEAMGGSISAETDGNLLSVKVTLSTPL